jgi:GT2 family glycosyltransferase
MLIVSVIIPTFNRLSRLKQAVIALEMQTYPRENFEVVIVSDGSTDGTNDYLNTIDSPLIIRTIIQSNAGPAAARNNGIRHAKGKYILFLDDDVVPQPRLIDEHMRLQEGRDNLILIGPMLTPPDFQLSPWVIWEQAMLEKQYIAMLEKKWSATARQFYTGNASLPRRLLLLESFNERFLRSEDVELAYRLASHKVEFLFTMAAEAHHYSERSFASWLQTPYAYGRNDIIFSRESHSWLAGIIRTGFQERSILARVFIYVYLSCFIFRKIALQILKFTGNISNKIGVKWTSIAIYSIIFNLEYYQGIADELGGWLNFFGFQQLSSCDYSVHSQPRRLR